jgi:hypothetical protein
MLAEERVCAEGRMTAKKAKLWRRSGEKDTSSESSRTALAIQVECASLHSRIFSCRT